MKSLAELAATGLRGKALSDALYEDRLGHPPPSPDRTPEDMRCAWDRFLEMQQSLTDEELAQDIFAGRPTNVSILVEEESAPNAHSA